MKAQIVGTVMMLLACGSLDEESRSAEHEIEDLEARIERVGRELATDDPTVVEPWLEARSTLELAYEIEHERTRKALVVAAEANLAEAVRAYQRPVKPPVKAIPARQVGE